MDPRIIFKLKRFELMKKSPPTLQSDAHDNGDVDMLLTNFCEYQKKLNSVPLRDPKHWDHAVLLTGFDMHVGGNKLAAGYAPVKGMCSKEFSCTIVEGFDFSTVFTLAHELGHSLGMLHDGRNNNCSPKCCLMSYISGRGKTTWSSCSIKEMNLFIRKLGRDPDQPNCLVDGQNTLSDGDRSVNSGGVLPGQRYTANQQCALTHGRCFRMDLKDGTNLASVCQMLYCTASDGFIFSAEPALEGTYCGSNRWCLEGDCRSWGGSNQPQLVNGQWSSWNEAVEEVCGGNQCSTCQIQNQFRIRRVIRYCESPAPDNGGKYCTGSAYRGLVCDQTPCSGGDSPNGFATKNCTRIMHESAFSSKMPTNGVGAQQPDDPCKMWCQMSGKSSFYWTVYNFPDGTSCGTNKYCLAGECLTLKCDSKFIVSDSSDCPKLVETSGQEKNQVSQPLPSVAPQQSVPAWSAWSAWSVCSKTCGSGSKTRSRQCTGGSCDGSNSETVSCENPICPPPASLNDVVDRKPFNSMKLPTRRPPDSSDGSSFSWSPWSPCSRTCGGGEQRRTMQCGMCPRPVVDSRTCGTESC